MVSLVERGERSLRLDGLANAARELKVSLDYLMGLTDDPTPAAKLTEQTTKFRSVAYRSTVQVGAGLEAFVGDEAPDGEIAFHERWLGQCGLNPDKCSVIDVLGDSMEPTLKDGGVILVDHQRTKLLENHAFVVRTGDGLLVKRLERHDSDWLLVSDNPEYEPLDLPEDAQIIGQVVWTGRML